MSKTDTVVVWVMISSGLVGVYRSLKEHTASVVRVDESYSAC